MYTEYNSQNMYQQYNYNQNSYNEDNNGKDTGFNKIFGVIWKILLVILVIVLLFLGLIQFGVIRLSSDVSPDTIVLNVNEIGIKKGRGYQLVTTILPENAKNKQVEFESSDPNIVSVNKVSGYIKGLKEGTATIKVRTLINDKETECVVNVQGDGVGVQSINLNSKNINLAVGYTYGLTYKVSPSNATELNMVFYSSDSSIATVDSNGTIRGVNEGNAIITISSNNGAITDTAYVTVYKKGTVSTPPSGEPVKTDNYPASIKLSLNSIDITKGSTAQLQASITPSNAISTISWKSSNNSVATVDENGLIRAVGVGSADIVVTTVNNKTASCRVNVGNYSVRVSSIEILSHYKFLNVGVSDTLYVAIKPEKATNRTITWSSSNPNVVSVDNSGKITAKSNGSAIITAKSEDGGHTSTATIEVGGSKGGVEAKSISFKKSTYDVGLNSTISLSSNVTFNPSNTTYTALTYTSSNNNVATVDSNTGLVRGTGIGSATITAVTKQGNAKATTTINVKNIPVTSVSLNKTDVTLSINEIFTLSSTVNPTDASDKTVTYTSRNTSVASVDKNGTIKAIGYGTTTIDVKPNGGGSSSTCVVTVK